MLDPKEALSRILERASPLPPELSDLPSALGRVLHTPVRAGRVLPPWDNSAMDGFAVRALDILAAKGTSFPIQGTLAAGQTALTPLAKGQVIKIMTGAPLPQGADAVIMREEAEEDPEGQTVRFRIAPKENDHIRRAGEDVPLGAEVLPRGAVIGPSEIGLLSALGRSFIEVYRRPVVSIVSTGDELVAVDQTLGPGQIVGSNAHALAALVTQAGGIPRILPFARDDRAALEKTFAEALGADLVLSTGGVSVGDFDHVKEVLRSLGVTEHFWQVAMKPGKPLTFGSLGPRLVFGLPGNPASSMVSFELFVRPTLRRLLGFAGAALQRPRALVVLEQPIAVDRKRLHFVRAHVTRDEKGAHLRARALRQQGSGMLRSMIGANALLEIAAGPTDLPSGTEVMANLLEAI